MTAIRRPGAASATVLLALATGLVAAHALAPGWSRRAGLDVWNLAEAQRTHRCALEDAAAADERAERAARRRAVANQLAADLVAGTAALAPAADRLRALFDDDPGVLVSLEIAHPGARTPRLRFARHAIDRATRSLAGDPARRGAVTARLEAEYRALAAREPSAP